MRTRQQFNTVLKPSGRKGLLVTEFGSEVTLEFLSCDFCHRPYIGIWYNDDGENPIQLAVSICHSCSEGKLVEV